MRLVWGRPPRPPRPRSGRDKAEFVSKASITRFQLHASALFHHGKTMDWGWALVGAAGIEPATLGLEIRCSILLSYAPKIRQLQLYQGVPEITHMGYDLVKCLHRLSIAQHL